MSRDRDRGEGPPNPSDNDYGGDPLGHPPHQDDPYRWQSWWERAYLQFADGLERYAQALLRRYGVTHIGGEEPRDLVQSFFWTLMKTDGLRKWDDIRNVNCYLYSLFWRHVRSRHRHASAQRRRPKDGFAAFPLDALRARSLPQPREHGYVHWAVGHALDTLHDERPLYAALIEEMIDEHDGRNVRPDLGERLGVAARHLATLRYRARRAFGRLFFAALRILLGDGRLLEEMRRRFLPWLSAIRPRPSGHA